MKVKSVVHITLLGMFCQSRTSASAETYLRKSSDAEQSRQLAKAFAVGDAMYVFESSLAEEISCGNAQCSLSLKDFSFKSGNSRSMGMDLSVVPPGADVSTLTPRGTREAIFDTVALIGDSIVQGEDMSICVTFDWKLVWKYGTQVGGVGTLLKDVDIVATAKQYPNNMPMFPDPNCAVILKSWEVEPGPGSDVDAKWPIAVVDVTFFVEFQRTDFHQGVTRRPARCKVRLSGDGSAVVVSSDVEDNEVQGFCEPKGPLPLPDPSLAEPPGDNGDGEVKPPEEPPKDPTLDEPCFEGSNLVRTPLGLVQMKALRAGDLVEAMPGVFEPILLLPQHWTKGTRGNENIKTEYLSIEFGKGISLLQTEGHMIFAGKKANDTQLVRAGDLRLGDWVQTETGESARITRIQRIQGQGAFTPYTPSLKIVVSGLQTSCLIDHPWALSQPAWLIWRAVSAIAWGLYFILPGVVFQFVSDSISFLVLEPVYYHHQAMIVFLLLSTGFLVKAVRSN